MDRITGKVAARFKEAASEIDLSEIPEDRQRFIAKLESRFGKAFEAWDGIHGIIVRFEARGVQVNRLDKDDLKSLLSDSKFRWVEAGEGVISVGM